MKAKTFPAIKTNYFLCFSLAFLPAILFLIWLLIMKISGSPVTPTPVVSDELFWYHQISAMVDSNMPLGYYGYNGTHAPIGTFGPWGIAILIPYGIWGKIFGWGLYSMCIANVTFLGVALCLFAIMCKLTRAEIPYVAIGYCTVLLNTFYSVSSMAEPLRWSMAIILTGCIIRIYKGECGRLFKYVIAPLIILYCAESFLLLSLFIPVYLILVLPIRRLFPRIAVSAAITAILAYLLRKLLFLVVSPLYVTSDTPKTLMETVKSKIESALQVLYQVSPAGLWKHRATSYGFPSIFLLSFVLLLLICLVLTLKFRKSKKTLGYLFACYLMAGALGGYCLIYHSPSFWTICRGLNTAFVSAVLILALYKSKKITIFCLMFAVISLPSFYRMSENNLDRRYLTEEEYALYETAEIEFSQLFDISEENSGWDNTIAQYGSRKAGAQTALTLALPRSAGYNSMLNSDIVSEARYAVVFNSFSDAEKYKQVISNLQDHGYSNIYRHKSLTILARDAAVSANDELTE